MLLGCRIAALFSPKVRTMMRGQDDAWRKLRQYGREGGYVWFHAASLGEFEQGRPLMERLRQLHARGKKVVFPDINRLEQIMLSEMQAQDTEYCSSHNLRTVSAQF